MSGNLPDRGLQIESTLRSDGTLHIGLTNAAVVQPGKGEVLLRIEAAPINPSDLMTLLASADPVNATACGTQDAPQVTISLSPKAAAAKAGRCGQSLTVGMEGAGTVIAAGPDAEYLLGKRVATLALSRGMYAQYKTLKAEKCTPLPDDVSARDGAALFCNPMTALAIAEAMQLEGHSAMIHTAAASNLGQMLVRICREDGIPLVNIVRREEQAALLREIGATHIVNSAAPDFHEALRRAIAETGATIAFDAIGGGAMAGDLLQAMEDVAVSRMTEYSPYGSTDSKQVFVYGHLDPTPIVLDHEGYGMFWDVRLWAMPSTMAQIGPERAAELQQRIIDGLQTTFISQFSREISLTEMLDPGVMQTYARMATGEKFIVNPQL